MKDTKKNKQLQADQKIILFGSIIMVWLLLLTLFTVWAWDQHMWQAEVDSDAIYKLMVENTNQQNAIDKLTDQ